MSAFSASVAPSAFLEPFVFPGFSLLELEEERRRHMALWRDRLQAALGAPGKVSLSVAAALTQAGHDIKRLSSDYGAPFRRAADAAAFLDREVVQRLGRLAEPLPEKVARLVRERWHALDLENLSWKRAAQMAGRMIRKQLTLRSLATATVSGAVGFGVRWGFAAAGFGVTAPGCLAAIGIAGMAGATAAVARALLFDRAALRREHGLRNAILMGVGFGALGATVFGAFAQTEFGQNVLQKAGQATGTALRWGFRIARDFAAAATEFSLCETAYAGSIVGDMPFEVPPPPPAEPSSTLVVLDGLEATRAVVVNKPVGPSLPTAIELAADQIQVTSLLSRLKEAYHDKLLALIAPDDLSRLPKRFRLCLQTDKPEDWLLAVGEMARRMQMQPGAVRHAAGADLIKFGVELADRFDLHDVRSNLLRQERMHDLVGGYNGVKKDIPAALQIARQLEAEGWRPKLIKRYLDGQTAEALAKKFGVTLPTKPVTVAQALSAPEVARTVAVAPAAAPVVVSTPAPAPTVPEPGKVFWPPEGPGRKPAIPADFVKERPVKIPVAPAVPPAVAVAPEGAQSKIANCVYEELNKDDPEQASWYGHFHHGHKMANGRPFNMNDPTQAAHKTLPLGTQVEVTNLENGRLLRVRVTDRGPFVDGRNIDLSMAGAEALGFKEAGHVPVRLRVYAGGVPVGKSIPSGFPCKPAKFELG